MNAESDHSDSPPNEEPLFPKTGRIAAVDFGSVRIGIAICDPEQILASPYEVHPAANWQADGDYYRRIADQEQIAGFVVGLPIHLDGGESQKSKECRVFARWLAEQTSKPVRLFDERFTTADARSRISGAGYSHNKKKKRVDAIAAFVLLEAFLEACRYRGQVAGQSINTPPEGGDSIEK